MTFFDCRMSYGKYINNGPYKPCETIDELAFEMDKSSIKGGFVYNVAADNGGVVLGNQLLSDDLIYAASKYPHLWLRGMYTLLPYTTRELPTPEKLPRIMASSSMGILRLNPAAHRYLPKAHVLEDYLSIADERKIPVLFDTAYGISISEVDDILDRFQNLTAILNYNNVWPCDRILYPFLKRYKNLRIDTTNLIADQVYEKAVSLFGASRFVYGSGFPVGYMGINMLTIVHSDLSEMEKSAIACDNLLNMIKEADFS